MNKEVLFAKTLEEVRALAKEQGNCVSEEQVQEAFAALDLNNDQLQMVFDYLVKHKVGIGQPVNMDDYLTDEERNYLQDYLDEIAQLPKYSQGEKEACIISAMAGETPAQNRLVEMYLENVVDIAKEYIKQNYSKALSLDEVSYYVNISPYYFSKIFKEGTGENFIEYLTNIRIEKAKELLGSTDYSMKEICVMVGYSDPNYFSRSFKKNVGVTPTEYKEVENR